MMIGLYSVACLNDECCVSAKVFATGIFVIGGTLTHVRCCERSFCSESNSSELSVTLHHTVRCWMLNASGVALDVCCGILIYWMSAKAVSRAYHCVLENKSVASHNSETVYLQSTPQNL